MNKSIYKYKINNNKTNYNQLHQNVEIVSIHIQNNTLIFLIKNGTFVSNSVCQSLNKSIILFLIWIKVDKIVFPFSYRMSFDCIMNDLTSK